MDQSSDSDDDNDKLHGSISLGTEDEDVNNVGKSWVEEGVVLPSVQQVGRVSNPTEPGGGCSPRFIMDQVVTGILIQLREEPKSELSNNWSE